MDTLFTGILGVFILAVFLILAILWIFMPWWLLRRLDALEREAKTSNAQMDTLLLHIATLNENLLAYGKSMERRLDAIYAAKQTPEPKGSGARYQMRDE
jgi:HAMP domain-containing protein